MKIFCNRCRKTRIHFKVQDAEGQTLDAKCKLCKHSSLFPSIPTPWYSLMLARWAMIRPRPLFEAHDQLRKMRNRWLNRSLSKELKAIGEPASLEPDIAQYLCNKEKIASLTNR